MKTVKLTPSLLKKFIKEESAKFGSMTDVEDADAEETDADEFADSLEKQIDYMKALKIEEARVSSRLRKIKEARARVLQKIHKKLV